MTATIRVLAGECTTRFSTNRGRPADDSTTESEHEGEDSTHEGAAPTHEGAAPTHEGAAPTHDERVHRGRVVVVWKPDGTLLVHDADGYQPVAWLTRATAVEEWDESVDGPVTLTAVDGDERLEVAFRSEPARTSHPVTTAGRPVADCPQCGSTLVVARGEVTCLGCGSAYAVPTGGEVTDGRCESCGLPEVQVRRGESFTVCLDCDCGSLSAAVRDALDREAACPDCGSDLRVEDHRGRQFLGCDDYPDCETAFSIPTGVVVGDCVCGLPIFESESGRRCLDGSCEDECVAAESDVKG